MHSNAARLTLVLCVSVAGCGGSPADPSSVAPEQLLRGRTVSAVDGTPTAGLTVHVNGARSTTTDSGGYFQTTVDGPGSFAATIVGGTVVERTTTVTGPQPDGVKISLIPSTFDLDAFEEMFRSATGQLQRWTTRPHLVVLATVMAFRTGASEFVATDEPVTDGDIEEIVRHLKEGLFLLTGGTYDSFGSVAVERPPSGARVSTTRQGVIVVGRYSGITSLAGTIGLGRWAEDADGSIHGGAMFLDKDFDRLDNRRRLLRFHELGHALGYMHVTTRTSIMNPAIGPEPTAFDRAGAIIAFQRPPGNRAPDADPGSSPRHTSGPGGSLRWVAPVS